MKDTATVGDACTHGAVVIEGSPDVKADGKAVARLGDKVNCPTHGINKIVDVEGGMPKANGLPIAHNGAKTACGAVLQSSRSVKQGSGSGEGGAADSIYEEAAIELEDADPEEVEAYFASNYGSNAADIQAIYAAPPEGGIPDPDETVAPSEENSAPVSCGETTNATPDSALISLYYSVGSFSSRAGMPHTIPTTTALGLSRAQVICNLKFLAVNSIDKIREWADANGYVIKIGSAFRDRTNGSDHNRGQAADLWFYHAGTGERVSRATLLTIAKQLVASPIPYTQFLLEFKAGSRGWIHVANRQSGNSNPRVAYTFTGGSPFISSLPLSA